MDWPSLLRKVRLQPVVLVVSILALIGWGITSYQISQYNKCQAMVVDRVIQVLDLRSSSVDAERAAEVQTDRAFRDTMNVLLAQPPKTQQERIQALVNLQRMLDEQDRQRALADRIREEHPIPDLPSRSC